LADFTLIIGNKNYSSWSLRGWLALAMTGAAFEAIVIPLDLPETAAALRRHSPSGRVPCLRHNAPSSGDSLVIWDSLAIGEYLAELFPEAGLWPQDRAARALARSVTAEMHSGFATLRSAWPMDLRRRLPYAHPGAAVAADCARILALWRDCRAAALVAQGPFLFGRPSLADAAFAPVAARFLTYGLPLDPVADAYVRTLWDWPLLATWRAAAEREPWVIACP